MACVGIDLGTTYSCVGVWKNGKVDIIPNDQGNRVMPSYVSFNVNDRLIGDAAKNQVFRNIENTVFDAKRIIGREFRDPIVQSYTQLWPFKVVEGINKKPMVSVRFKGVEELFTPEQISSMVLEKLKSCAEVFLGTAVTEAVITVPANFNDAQRTATRNAGRIAGLKVKRIINEPTAAAMAYGFEKRSLERQIVLVFDLGGGTFDVSLLSIQNGNFEVIATKGDTHLGGNDFDNRMVQVCLQEFNRQYDRDISKDKRFIGKLRQSCERAKRELSTSVSTSIEAEIGGEDFSLTMTRAKFEELNMDYFQKCIDIITLALNDASLRKDQINEIILVGGSSRIIKVQQLVKTYFNGKDLNLTIHPDEAIAYGAAIQSAILSGEPEVQDCLLLDVTPLSLGIKTIGDIFSTIIPRNTVIPTRLTKDYTTAYDDQKSIGISIYEGERPIAGENNLLGVFTLSGIRLAPKGVPKIDVTIEIDADGITSVTAVDRHTKSSNEIILSNHKGRLTPEEISLMIATAERFRRYDLLRKRKAEAANMIESAIYDSQSVLGLSGSSSLEIDKLRQLIQEAKTLIESIGQANVAELEPKVAELEAKGDALTRQVDSMKRRR